MPRRSARIKDRNEEHKEMEIDSQIEAKQSTTSNSKAKKGRGRGSRSKSQSKASKASADTIETTEESVSNKVSSDEPSQKITTSIDDTEQKETSVQAEDIEQPMQQLTVDAADEPKVSDNNDGDDDVNMAEPEVTDTKPDEEEKDVEQDEDESEEAEPTKTIAQGRSRRNVKQRVSYKDDSSSEEEEEEEESEDADDPMYAGLNKEERQLMRERMAKIHDGRNDAIKHERALKIQEIIGSFDLNIGQTVTEEEAGFMYDFCRKHQENIIEKIEEEGDFFLMNMREMMEEKMKLIKQGIRTSKNKKSKKRKDDDSESEFDMNDFMDDDDEESDWDSLDSDWENPDLDNDNLISDEEDDWSYGQNRNRKRGGNRRRNKNTYVIDGREYYAKGRLLLADALKDTTNFEGWSAARVQAWKNKEVNPNAYYYRFNDPDDEPVNGPLVESEHKGFMERVKEFGVNVHWGTFSSKIPGRVGYQCSNYWRQMMKDGWVKDPNYWIRSDGSFSFKRLKKGSVPDNVRKFSFVVMKDPSGVFSPCPAYHPQRPADSTLAKFLEKNVKPLTDAEKKGGKKKKNKRETKKEDKEEKKDNDNDKEEVEDNTDTTEVKDGENKKKKKSKKKKKDKDGDDENEDGKTKKKKGSKKKKKSSKKNKNDKDGDDVDEDGKSKKKKKSKKKDKKKKDKKGDDENEDGKTKKKGSKKKKDKKKNKNKDKKENESEVEDVVDTEETGDESGDKGKKAKRGKKRKRSDDEDGNESSELEPPQKKRKMGQRNDINDTDYEEEEEEEQQQESPMSILGKITDIMTGATLKCPAISPFGHVMEYNSWCSILRNPRTKNKCPFTKQSMTRRSLVKLNANNINEYKDKIINITEEDMKKLNV